MVSVGPEDLFFEVFDDGSILIDLIDGDKGQNILSRNNFLLQLTVEVDP
mgnify:CR=1 FL=1